MNALLVIFFISYALYSFFNNLKFWFVFVILLALYYYLSQVKFFHNSRSNLNRKISVSAWSTPYDPQVYTTVKLDITKIIPYLDKKSKEISEHLTPTIFAIKLMSIVLIKYPEISGYIKFGRYEPKEGVDICCLVNVGGGSELANTTITNCEKKNFKKIVEELMNSVKKLRERKNAFQNKKMNFYKLVPTFIMGPLTQLFSYLSAIGVKAEFLGVRKFEFGSCVITSIGGLGIEYSLVPIPPVSFSSLILTLCAKYDVNKKNEKGEIETKTYLTLNFTTDYRFFDFKTASEMFKSLHKIGSDPDLFEEECKKYENEKYNVQVNSDKKE